MIKALEFTLAVNRCMGCSECPQTVLGEAYKSPKKSFSEEDFRTIVDKMPMDCFAHFSGFNEAMLHPKFADFFEYVGARGLRIYLYTTLVGLNERKAEAVAKSNVEYIRLHLPNKSEFMFDETRWLKLLDLFMATGKPFSPMTLADLDPDFHAELSGRGITVERPQILSRAGNNGWTAPGRPITGPVTCQAARWRMNEVMPSGDVYLDSMDWALKMP